MTDPRDPVRGAGPIERDADRVRIEYQRRAEDPALRDYYRRIGPIVDRAHRQRRDALLGVLDGLGPRDALRVLDAGCGSGDDLVFLAGQGFTEEQLAGVDVFPPSIDEARARLPGAAIRVGNIADLRFPSDHFDVVTLTTVLSSVVDPVVQRAIGSEILRVLRIGGVVISYDMRSSPRENPHLVGVTAFDLRRIFPGAHVDRLERMTLAFWIARRVPEPLRSVLDTVPWLRSHLLAVVRKSARGPA